MTDVTSQTAMRSTHRRKRGAEYNLYFTLIFLLTLPFASVGWVRDIVRLRTLNLHGPLARAWREADAVTPLIFSA